MTQQTCKQTIFIFVSLVSSPIHFRTLTYTRLSGWRDTTLPDENEGMKKDTNWKRKKS